MAQKLIIIRGLPGSGKSTFAKKLLERNPRMKHFEADMYFVKDGEYTFDPKEIRNAHRWCQDSVYGALIDGLDVVVSNTFTQLWELQRYLNLRALGKVEVIVVEMRNLYGNIHGVPASKVEAMEDRWEDFPEEEVLFEVENDEIFLQILK